MASSRDTGEMVDGKKHGYWTDISQKHSEPTKHQCEAGLSP